MGNVVIMENLPGINALPSRCWWKMREPPWFFACL